MLRYDPAFVELLGGYDLTELASHEGAVYGIWADFRLAYLNPAWFRFALENGGEPAVSERWNLGASILDAMPPVLATYYRRNYGGCLAAATVWQHEYECSSAGAYRRFHQIVYPLGDAQGLLLVNSLNLEHAHEGRERPAHDPAAAYRDDGGFVEQCSHCRRTRHREAIDRWDWIPAWVHRPPDQTSHSFCPPCFAHSYQNRALR